MVCFIARSVADNSAVNRGQGRPEYTYADKFVILGEMDTYAINANR